MAKMLAKTEKSKREGSYSGGGETEVGRVEEFATAQSSWTQSLETVVMDKGESLKI
jgi:hypothetical protein